MTASATSWLLGARGEAGSPGTRTSRWEECGGWAQTELPSVHLLPWHWLLGSLWGSSGGQSCLGLVRLRILDLIALQNASEKRGYYP